MARCESDTPDERARGASVLGLDGAKEAVARGRAQEGLGRLSKVRDQQLGDLDDAERREHDGHRLVAEEQVVVRLRVVVEEDGDDDPAERIEERPADSCTCTTERALQSQMHCATHGIGWRVVDGAQYRAASGSCAECARWPAA